jgi:hypothetical protein
LNPEAFKSLDGKFETIDFSGKNKRGSSWGQFFKGLYGPKTDKAKGKLDNIIEKETEIKKVMHQEKRDSVMEQSKSSARGVTGRSKRSARGK